MRKKPLKKMPRHLNSYTVDGMHVTVSAILAPSRSPHLGFRCFAGMPIKLSAPHDENCHPTDSSLHSFRKLLVKNTVAHPWQAQAAFQAIQCRELNLRAENSAAIDFQRSMPATSPRNACAPICSAM